ncbi:hypothetical protein BKA56DRAFT_600463 [Ilyonectria sp. MPI-CAGE-AT-0026]|nr:hypothetical protein BKA56DRAFT_600463 [Ilyonectria sp. MPI-CAGE-AT-0026]
MTRQLLPPASKPWRIKIGTSTCFNSLTAEVYHLKTQLSQHTDFSCVLIQKYMANEAKKSVVQIIRSRGGHVDMPLEPFKKAPVPVSSQPVASVSPLSRCEPELFIGM